MKGTTIRLGTFGKRAVAALLIDGVLEDLIVESDAPRPGTVYRARATRPVKGQGGMFFDTPDGPGFLRGAKGLVPGRTYLVQVTGHAEAGKAIPLTDRLVFKGRYAIATAAAPGINISRTVRDDGIRQALLEIAEPFVPDLAGCGIIFRSAAEAADPAVVRADLESTLDTAIVTLGDESTEMQTLFRGPGPEGIAWRDWPEAPPASDDLDSLIDLARRAVHPLPGGGSIAVEPTRALVAVDVNTGGDTSPAAGLKANIAAARDLPRLLRIKGLGGQIVMDTAPMPKKDRRAFETILRTAFRKDGIETTLVGWTTMGHYELNRKRARAPLHEIMP